MTTDDTERPSASPALRAHHVLARVPSPKVEWVEVDGEIVVWCADTEALHELDRPAALVFQLCDGHEALGATARDLAEAFGHTVADVERDVLACATELERMSIVERLR